MSAIRKNFWLWTLTASLFLSGWTKPLPAFPDPSADADHVTVILILDNSGSMQTSDPDELRYTGVRLFASLLDPNDSLGVILFSTRADVLIGGLVTLDSHADKRNLLARLRFEKANGYTDVKAGLEKAKGLLAAADLRDSKAVIVLLTDGKPEIPNPYPEYEREMLEVARSLNVPILAIALTTAAQTPFLDQLAAETNGAVFPADDASDLLDAYLQALGQVKDRTVIGGREIRGDASLEIESALAPYVRSLSLVAARTKNTGVSLFDPGGKEITAAAPNLTFAYSTDPRFSIFTLENPAGGTYTFRSQGGGKIQAWAILRSRLRVEVVEPRHYHPLGREMAVVVRLLEETTDGRFTRIIGEVNFTARITRPDGGEVSLDRFYDDGTHGDAVANDGDFTRIYPSTNVEGEYQISVQGWKDAIPVQAQSRVSVVQFPQIVVDAPMGTTQVRGEEVELRVHLEGGNPPMFDQGEVIAQVTSPSGRAEEIVLQGNGAYSGEILPVEDGEFRVVFETRDVKYRGVEYQTSLKHSFHVTIIPFVKVAVAEINIPSICFSQPDEIALTLFITASREENLRLSVPAGWRVLPESVKVKKGDQTIHARILDTNGLREETEWVDLLIEGGSRLEVQPDAAIRAEVHVPNVWVRCRTPIRLGGGFLILALIGAAAIQRVRKNTRPLPLSGTLRYWPTEGNPTQAAEVDLTAFGKASLSVGSGAACDAMIPHAGLEAEHIRLAAEKSQEGAEIYLEPIGEVRQGYHAQTARFLLRHGDTFRMGTYEFQYLSDHGE